MNVNQVYEIIQYIINKNQDGYMSPDEFNLIINQAQTSFVTYLLGELQQYQYGRPQSRISFGQNEIVRGKITPLINSPLLLTINAQGLSPYPVDYLAPDAMYDNSIYRNRIRFASQDKLHSYLASTIDPIESNPVYLIESTYLRFYPQNLGYARFSYIKEPPQMFWNSTDSIYGQPVYNPVGSVDPVFYDTEMLEIITRALKIAGVNLQTQQVIQYANEVNQMGQ